MVWLAVFERHVAVPSDGRHELSAAAALRKRKGDRTDARPAATHNLVHRARSEIYRTQKRPAVLPLRRAQHAARAIAREFEIRRSLWPRPLCRRRDGDRL